MKARTPKSSVSNLKRLFSNNPNDDEVSLKDAFIAWGRPNPENVDSHKAWMSGLLYHLTYNELVEPVYSFNTGRKKLVGIRLTIKGKKELGRTGGNLENDTNEVSPTNGKKPVSYGNLTNLVAQFKEENKEHYEVTFDVKLK